MKIADLKEKSEKELQELLAEDRDKVRDLRFKLASKQLKDVRILRKMKREIGQILTVLKDKETVKEIVTEENN